MDNYVSPSVWGPPTWDALYHIAAGYDPARKEYYRTLFKVWPFVMRCDECNQNCQGIVARRPVDSYLVDPKTVLKWVYLTHSDARKHQRAKNVPDFTFEDVCQRYLPPDEQPEETGPAYDESHPISQAAAARSSHTGTVEGFVSGPASSASSSMSERLAHIPPRGAGNKHPTHAAVMMAPMRGSSLLSSTHHSSRPAVVDVSTPAVYALNPAGRGLSMNVVGAYPSAYTGAGQVAPPVIGGGNTHATGTKQPLASAVGLTKCCKARMQMSTGVGTSFAV